MNLNLLKKLCDVYAPSGREDRLRSVILDEIQNLPVTSFIDPLGNLIVEKKGHAVPKNKLMMLAHMDEVGLIITNIGADGQLSFAVVGGIDERVLISRQVVVGDQLIPGVIGIKPIHLTDKTEQEKKIPAKKLAIDIGTLNKEESEALVQVGDFAAFSDEYFEFGDGMVCAKAIDDRFGCLMLLELLKTDLAYDTTFVFAVQEEIGLRGSKTATYRVAPDAAIVLDATTAADIPGSEGADRVCLVHGGPVITMMDRATLYDPALFRMAFGVAKNASIPCQTKTAVAGGNDAGSVHLSREGVRTLAVSLPTRYLHSQCCVGAVDDMEHTLALLPLLMDRMWNA